MPPPKTHSIPSFDPDLFETDPDTGKIRRKQPFVTQDQAPGEENGPKGPEPTRFGDWERKGIVSDF